MVQKSGGAGFRPGEIGSRKRGQRRPGLLGARGSLRERGDRVAQSLGSEPRFEGIDAGRFTGGLDGHRLAQYRKVRPSLSEGMIAADHQKAPAVEHVALEIFFVARHRQARIGVPEVLEDHDVEGIELGIEDFLHREGDQRQLPVAEHLRVRGERAQDVEADQVDVRILPQKPAQEPLVPRGPSDHEQNAHPIPNHFQRKRPGIVFGDHFLGEDRHRCGVDEPARLVRGDVEGDRLNVVLGIQPDALAGHRLSFAAKHHRNVKTFESPTVDHHLHHDRVAHESEVVDPDLVDREVFQQGAAHHEGGDWDLKVAQDGAALAHHAARKLGVVRPVREEEHPGELLRSRALLTRFHRAQRGEQIGARSSRRLRAQGLRGDRGKLRIEAVVLDGEAILKAGQLRRDRIQVVGHLHHPRFSPRRGGEAHRRRTIHQYRDSILDVRYLEVADPRLEEEKSRRDSGADPKGPQHDSPAQIRLAPQADRREKNPGREEGRQRGQGPGRQGRQAHQLPGIEWSCVHRLLFMIKGRCTRSSL